MFPVNEETDKKLENMAEKLCTTKSNLVAMLVAQQIDAFEKTWDLMQSGKLQEMIVKSMSTELEELEDKQHEEYEKLIYPNEKTSETKKAKVQEKFRDVD